MGNLFPIILKPWFHNIKDDLNASDIISHSTNNSYYYSLTSGPQYTYIYMTPLILYQALIDCILYANFLYSVKQKYL